MRCKSAVIRRSSMRDGACELPKQRVNVAELNNCSTALVKCRNSMRKMGNPAHDEQDGRPPPGLLRSRKLTTHANSDRPRSLEPALDQVTQAKIRMFPKHPRAGRPHHHLDLLSTVALNNNAPDTGHRLACPLRSGSGPNAGGRSSQRLTFRADRLTMLIATVDLHHRRDRLPLCAPGGGL